MSEAVALGDIGTFFDGPHATPTRTTDGPFFLNISSLDRGRLDLALSDHVSEEDFAGWTRRVIPQAGDLLFSYETRLGDAALMPEGVRACLGRRMALIRPKSDRVDSKYLLYFYLSPGFQRVIEERTIHGATVNRIALSEMPTWRVSLPSLADQRAIAEVLGALDDKIAANTKLATAIDEYLAGLLIAGLSAADEVPLATIAAVNEASVKPQPGGVLRYVDIASVGIGRHEWPEQSSWDSAPGRARRKLRRGDTVWSTVRPNRRSHSLNLSADENLVASTGLAVLTPKAVGYAYLYEASRLPEFTSYLENVAEGSAYPAVRADRFLDAPIPLLPDAERAEFDRTAEPLRELQHSLSAESRTLAATRDALLPQLMSGKLRLRDVEGVPA